MQNLSTETFYEKELIKTGLCVKLITKFNITRNDSVSLEHPFLNKCSGSVNISYGSGSADLNYGSGSGRQINYESGRIRILFGYVVAILINMLKNR